METTAHRQKRVIRNTLLVLLTFLIGLIVAYRVYAIDAPVDNMRLYYQTEIDSIKTAQQTGPSIYPEIDHAEKNRPKKEIIDSWDKKNKNYNFKAVTRNKYTESGKIKISVYKSNTDHYITRYFYDNQDRLIKETFVKAGFKIISKYTYKNNLLSKVVSLRAENGKEYKTDTFYKYDSFKRLTKKSVMEAGAYQITFYKY